MHPTSSDSAPVFDPDGLRQYCNGSEAIAQKLVEAFLKSEAGYLEAMGQAIHSRNVEEIRAACHKTWGAAATVRAAAIEAAVVRIREEAIAGNLAAMDGCLRDFTESFARFRAAILMAYPNLNL